MPLCGALLFIHFWLLLRKGWSFGKQGKDACEKGTYHFHIAVWYLCLRCNFYSK